MLLSPKPTWHPVQALSTLVQKDGHTPAVEGFFERVKPLTAAQEQMIREHASKTTESTVKQGLGMQHWVHDANMSGGYDPTQTDPGSKLIDAQLATYRKLGLDPQLWPRSAGSWPGFIFTAAPLSLPAGHFGLGHGTGAHAPDRARCIVEIDPGSCHAGEC
jgi:hypothetical protein